MLDSETKSRIDSARDILVGKVPDPKSQVEQITIALIYKFMGDMDHQSEELGGKATFFSGGYKQYSWNRLLDNRFGGHERLLLYAEGIEKMNENKNIPQLFRDIFKGVFLPYRDPETLNLFLKEINGFSYDHSERLGDAFEYLLSVMDSQGSAGQFRTPRHIIDFIVRIVDPKKNETILDPACGTAGFLISSYKHILAQHRKFSFELTPDERGRLMTNFCGYDISPDMVRLSRVNMYLHGFANPRIHEYDTLTSEERWDERYDVILANPPFMTPKGGIRPHNRFSIKATRSEVLFVDYIAEHLNVNGRAGIIVPEGIIFQSQNAYKKLRKMLIENYLWCVVSLPAGCFNPYSGVKTSVLLLGKSLAKRTDEILFVKVENDGFDLGAQRRPNGKNDLPEALSAISDFRLRIADLKKESSDNQKSEIQNQKSGTAHTVLKSKILASGDVNLSGDRYRDSGIRASTKWPMVSINELCENIKDTVIPSEHNGQVTYIGLENIESDSGVQIGQVENDIETIKSMKLRFTKGDILYGKLRPNLNKVWLADRDGICSTDIMVLRFNNNVAVSALFGHVLRQQSFNTKVLQGLEGSQLPRVKFSHFGSIKVPLPPIEVQEGIVEELDGYRKIIEGAKQVIANYKPIIKIDPSWPRVKLEEVADVTSSKRIFQGEYVSSGIPFYRTKEIVELSQDKPITLELFISEKKFEEIKEKFDIPQKGEILVSAVGTIGVSWVISDDRKFYFKDGNLLWIKNLKNIAPNFLKQVLDHTFSLRLNEYIFGAAYKALTIEKFKQIEIPLPDLETQQRIITQIEREQSLVKANNQLIEIYERKIQTKLAEIWGEEKND